MTRATKPRSISMWLGLVGCLLLPSLSQAQQKEHPLKPAIRIAKQSLAAAERVQDYEAVFSKQEVAGRSVTKQNMYVRVRHEPFSVYMRFIEPNAGREVIYVHGKNNNKILAHESGIKSIVGTVTIDPMGERAMKHSRYPITHFGLKKMLELLVKQWENETQFGEIDVKYYPNATLGQVQCKVIQTSHPVPRRQFPYHITRLYIDKATNLPVRLEQYGYPTAAGQQPPLKEQYTYSNLRVNQNLGDIAFDPRNPKYKF